VPEALTDSSSLQEVLWNFYLITDKEKRLTLMENPHFYAGLPMSLDAYGSSLKVDPTEDFRRGDRFYVLTDKPELIYIMTDHVSRSFGNVWRPKIAVIFKRLGFSFFFPPLFLTLCQTSVGGLAGKILSRYLSEAHAVGSVSGLWCPPFREISRIVVDCGRLSQRGIHQLVGNV
jgi:hypothetical protein